MIRFVTSRPSSRTVGREPLRLRKLVPTGVLLLAIFGLTMQALQGDRGWSGWQNLQSETSMLHQDLAALKQQNNHLQSQVLLLSDDQLDLDFLDERARIVLGLVNRKDTVIFKTDPRLSESIN